MTTKKNNPFLTACSVLALGIAAAAFAGAPAHANSTYAENEIEIKAEIPNMCSFDQSFDNEIEIEPLHNGRPAGNNSKVESTAQVTCNVAASVELSSNRGGMALFPPVTPDNDLGASYLTSFDYAATLKTASGDVVTLDTASDNTATADANTAFDGSMPTELPLTLEIVPEEVEGVLQAGIYLDTLTVRITPQD
jgi:hypothetical protein